MLKLRIFIVGEDINNAYRKFQLKQKNILILPVKH